MIKFASSFLFLVLVFFQINTHSLFAQPNWFYTQTANSHAILIQQVSILGNPAANGDYVGVFYDSLGVPACAGLIIWTGSNTAIAAWGNNTYSSVKDGFADFEEFQWRIWRASDSTEYLAEPAYMASFSDSNLFFPNGISGLSSLNAYELYFYPFVTEASVNPVSCYGNCNASISIQVTGGEAPYTFLWSNGASDSELHNLCPGNYSVTVSDQTANIPSNQLPWTYTMTSALHNIIVSQPIVTVNGQAPDVGDYVGVFYTLGGQEFCAGYSIWTGGNINVFAFGNDVNTPVKDGFYHAEQFIWKLWRLADNQVVPMVAQYSPFFPNLSSFSAGGLSSLSSLSGTYLSPPGPAINDTVISFSIEAPAQLLFIDSISNYSGFEISEFGASDGFIYLEAFGGTPPYEYTWSNGSTDSWIENLIAGSYSLILLDANDCEANFQAILTEPEQIFEYQALAEIIDALCYQDCSGSINIEILGGEPPYSYAWSNGDTTATIDSLCAGIYTLTVTDSSMPQANQSFDWTFSQTNLVHMVSVSPSNLTVNGISLVAGDYIGAFYENNGELFCAGYIEFNGVQSGLSVYGDDPTTPGIKEGFYPGEEFNWMIYQTQDNFMVTTVFANYNSSFLHNSLFVAGGISGISSLIGSYQPTVPSNTLELTYLVGENSPIVIDALISDYNGYEISFYDESDGSIELILSGGFEPYSILWSNGATSSELNGLSVGNYSVSVSDGNSCIASATFLLTQPMQQLFISSNPLLINETCVDACNGSIVPNPMGAFPPYFYEWSNGAITESIHNLCPGSYSVTISDSNFPVQTPGPLPWSFINTGIQHTFLLQSGTINITGLAIEAGDYIGAFYEDGGDLFCGGYVQWSGSNTTLLARGNNATGSKNGFAPGETIQWKVWKSNYYFDINLTATYSPAFPAMGSFTAGGTSVVTSLLGAYELVSGTDPLQLNFEILPANPLLVTHVQSSISCFAGNDGSIELNIIGGNPPYALLWSNGDTTVQIENLIAGIYSFTLIDSEACEYTDEFTLSEPGPLQAYLISEIDPACYGSNEGEILLSPSGGTAPYQIIWNDGNSDFSRLNLLAGNYSYTLTDNHNCEYLSTVELSEPDSIQIELIQQINPVCFTDHSGVLTVEIAGGTEPYQLLWSNGSTTESIQELAPGIYQLTVSDINSCVSEIGFEISSPSLLYAQVLIYDTISCAGFADGSILVNVSGGTPIYGITWNDGNQSFQRTNLSAGEYSYTVSDLYSCSFESSVTLEEPDELIINLIQITPVSCFGFANGSIQIEASGGTIPYYFNWSNAGTSAHITGLYANSYGLVVSDANNCTTSMVYEVQEPNELQFSVTSLNPVSCYGGNDGNAFVEATGGTAPYSIIWSDNSSNLFERTTLTAGVYQFTISDSNNCELIESIEILEPEVLEITFIDVVEISCFGFSDGEIALLTQGGTSPYNIQWSNGSTSALLQNLTSGSYHVSVSDNNNCMVSSSIQMVEPAELQISSIAEDATCPTCSDGSVGVNMSGGTNPYYYNWSNGATTASLSNIPPGVYSLSVNDANDCSLDTSFDIGPVISSPGWSFTNTGNNHTILVQQSTIITIDNNPIVSGDYIGVFFDSLGTPVCAGYIMYTGQTLAIAAFGQDDGLDGFAFNEKFQWYIWKSDSQLAYPAEASYMTNLPNQGNYVINGMSGLASLSVITTGSQEINLVFNWNFFSTYIDPYNAAFDTVVSSISDKIILAKDFAGNPYWPAFGLNQIGNMTIGEAYQIRVNEACSFLIEGSIVFPEFNPIYLPFNWSFPAYLRNNPAPIASMLSSFESNVIIVKNTFGFIYWPAFGVNDIGMMLPGQGFSFKMNSSAVLTYPPNAIEYNSSKYSIRTIEPQHFPQPSSGEYNQTIGIPLHAWPIPPEYGDEVAAINSAGDLVGSVVFNGGNMAFTIWGSQQAERNKLTGMESFELIFWRKSDNQEFAISNIVWFEGSNTFEDKQLSIVEALELNQELPLYQLNQNTPNPFRNETYITYSLPESGQVEIGLFNLIGEKIMIIFQGNQVAGEHTVLLSAEKLPAGSYYYQLISKGRMLSRKMVKVQ